ncbi:hypothetical protein JCM3770_005433 [Rhodotorula araucariae]
MRFDGDAARNADDSRMAGERSGPGPGMDDVAQAAHETEMHATSASVANGRAARRAEPHAKALSDHLWKLEDFQRKVRHKLSAEEKRMVKELRAELDRLHKGSLDLCHGIATAAHHSEKAQHAALEVAHSLRKRAAAAARVEDFEGNGSGTGGYGARPLSRGAGRLSAGASSAYGYSEERMSRTAGRTMSRYGDY